MPKLKKEECVKREAFALEIFKRSPKLSVAKANAEVKIQFGSNIRAIRMYEIRKKAGLFLEIPAPEIRYESSGAS